MSYLDFLIRKEHAFIRNIFDEDDLKRPKNIANLKSYHEAMVLFIHLAQIVENEINSISSYDQIFDEKLETFLREECSAYSDHIKVLVNEIKSVEIKNSKALKIPQIYIANLCFYI